LDHLEKPRTACAGVELGLKKNATIPVREEAERGAQVLPRAVNQLCSILVAQIRNGVEAFADLRNAVLLQKGVVEHADVNRRSVGFRYRPDCIFRTRRRRRRAKQPSSKGSSCGFFSGKSIASRSRGSPSTGGSPRRLKTDTAPRDN
jgi:hypothetical protein